MKDGNFYHIAGWMGSRLELRANDLICFAVIYSFSQDGESQFKGKLEFLSSCMFATKPTVLSCLNKLEGLNLILKKEKMVDGRKRCYYQTNIIYNDGVFEVVDTGKEPLTAIGKEPLTVTGKEPLPDTSYDNKKKDNKEKKLSNDNSKKGFVKPTIEDIQAYIDEKKLHFDAERFFYFYESKGWKVGKNPMTDWKAACYTWEGKRKEDIKAKSEEENPKEELPAGLTPEKWANITKWLHEHYPRIAEKITPDLFQTLHGMAHFKSLLFADIMLEIEQSGYVGDITPEFQRVLSLEKYYSRLW